VEVYFDDMKVEHVKGKVVQMDDFYPFGLTFNSYYREQSTSNRWRFQGQENVDELALNWDSFKWRNHQPDIGRFFNVDPLAEKYYYNSCYAFSENKVVAHVELEGLESISYRAKTSRSKDKVEIASFTVDLKAHSRDPRGGFVGRDTDTYPFATLVEGSRSVDKPEITGKGNMTYVEGSLDPGNGATYRTIFTTNFDQFSDEDGYSYGTISADVSMEEVNDVQWINDPAEIGTIEIDGVPVLTIDGGRSSSGSASATFYYRFNGKDNSTLIIGYDWFQIEKKAAEEKKKKQEEDATKEDF
jgi:RHS repeat-associated protein